jgi:biotin operon repressor
MARSPEFEPLYQAFEQFMKRCVLDDRSFLWPSEMAWSPENVTEVKRRMVDTPLLGSDLSFEEKLQEQMRGASRELWTIVCDVYYIYFLPSSYITIEKKQHDIHWAARQGGLTPPPEDAEVWMAQECGFTRTSLRYHYKYAQFWLILLFANHLKGSEDPKSIKQDPRQVQEVLDGCLASIEVKNDRAYDMRHAILYLAFPDHYERIISTRDKERIVQTYEDRIEGAAPDDLDEVIRRIRSVLTEEHETGDRPFDFYKDVKREWRPGTEPPVDEENGLPPDEPELLDVSVVRNVLARTRNVILYGPPGTGKTFIAKRTAEAMVQSQIEEPLSETALIHRAIEGLTPYEIIALTMYRMGPQGAYALPEILDQPLMKGRQRTSPVKHLTQNTWGHLQSHTPPNSTTVGVSNRREPYLFDKDEQSRWCLTDQGREYVEQSLASQIEILNSNTEVKSTEEFIRWATFHQSYAYEDFVEGLRPILSEEGDGDVSYNIVPGVFRRICTRAAEDPGNRYVLVIDEINRGNIAKILGELITLLEDDKRAGKPNALSVTLPYSGDAFVVPSNLYIIGTMNTADRSIALLDVALRRRFAFVELMPRAELLDGTTVETEEASVSLSALLRSLNQGIRRYLDRDHQIGHSYFLKVAETSEAKRVEMLEFVWNSQVIPLLEEYFYSQRDKLAELLAPFRTDVESGIEVVQEEGLDFEIGRQSGDDLVIALAKLAGRREG